MLINTCRARLNYCCEYPSVLLQVAQEASSLLPRTPAATNPATARHLAAAYGDQVGLNQLSSGCWHLSWQQGT